MSYVRLLLAFLFLLTGCVTQEQAPPPVQVVTLSRTIDYQAQVRPILDRRCVVCHSCYNSPCQLKLDSYEGLERGASKKVVYDPHRLLDMEPTRLFIDAKNAEEWQQKKGFHRVTKNTAQEESNNTILLTLLDHKKNTPFDGCEDFKPEEDKLTCADSGAELGEYLKKHPNRGMPYGFPPLKDVEFQVIVDWLAGGGKGPDEAEVSRLTTPTPTDKPMIEKWEAFLNNKDLKNTLVARYLYEHLFLAHINFSYDSNDFYELIRSAGSLSEPLNIINTVLPYDDPGKGEFSYRFRKIHSTIVHKTHMVVTLSSQQFERIDKVFIQSPHWPENLYPVGYDKETSANPFKAFAQIPPDARYQFLLDNIHYIIMTFIRGPVCKGQVALNVVRDQFWLVFLDPQYDISVQDPSFIADHSRLLEMPLIENDIWNKIKSLLNMEFRRKSSGFVKSRQRVYDVQYGQRGPGAEAIWNGGSKEESSWRQGWSKDTPILTVLRHFDSASVEAGPLGNLPDTLWVMDYPLVERIYYSLVAGFNVFGSFFHQVSIRLYMDELRQEGETYFIDFMPKQQRRPMMQKWYGKKNLDSVRVDYSSSAVEAGFPFATTDPKREFIEYLVKNHFRSDLQMDFDYNYLKAGENYPNLPDKFTEPKDYIQGFRAVSKPGTAFFSIVKDHDANLAYIRLIGDGKMKDHYLSVVVNRWHDDVSTVLFEEKRLKADRDSAIFLEGFVGSYPNYFLEVKMDEVRDFLEVLQSYDGSENSRRRLEKYGVNRARSDFWDVYDWFQCEFNQQNTAQAGLLDLNRYYHRAVTENLREPRRIREKHPACRGVQTAP